MSRPRIKRTPTKAYSTFNRYAGYVSEYLKSKQQELVQRDNLLFN